MFGDPFLPLFQILIEKNFKVIIIKSSKNFIPIFYTNFKIENEHSSHLHLDLFYQTNIIIVSSINFCRVK